MSPAAAFAITSCLTVAAGCFVAASAGVGAAVWSRNAAAWLLGGVIARLLTHMPPARLYPGLLLLAPLALFLTLFSQGQSGVHRWLRLGPLSWNVAFLLLPAATVALAAMAQSRRPRTALIIAPLIGCALCLQPDAAQATAFGAAATLALLTTQPRSRATLTVCALLVLSAAFGWTRPDPLQPVPEVEGILELARSQSPIAAALCVIALASVSASPLFVLAKVRPAAHALCVYFVLCAVMPLFGAFPVPLLGMGMSPILGFWLAVGVLATLPPDPVPRPTSSPFATPSV